MMIYKRTKRPAFENIVVKSFIPDTLTVVAIPNILSSKDVSRIANCQFKILFDQSTNTPSIMIDFNGATAPHNVEVAIYRIITDVYMKYLKSFNNLANNKLRLASDGVSLIKSANERIESITSAIPEYFDVSLEDYLLECLA